MSKNQKNVTIEAVNAKRQEIEHCLKTSKIAAYSYNKAKLNVFETYVREDVDVYFDQLHQVVGE